MGLQLNMIIPLVLYLSLNLAIAFWARRNYGKNQASQGFLEEYFLGTRSMGGFVLAMAIIASYTSASSFIGGPGIAYTLGLSWVLLAMIQVPTTFLTLGVLGKKMAIISRKTSALTITEILRIRYKSDALVIICSLAILLFFSAAMLAQFIGGARLFQAVTGYSYFTGLMIFGVTVIIYTTIGGFRAVSLTDALQGIVMLIAAVVILFAVVNAGGGIENIMLKLKTIDKGLISPYGAGGAVPKPMMLSFWVLVGFAILGLPQTVQKTLAYKDAKSMHLAMFLGTMIIGFLLLCVHLAGTFGRVVLPDLESGDLAIPSLTVTLLSPFWAGIFIAGPLAAIMSTVDSMLIIVSASIVKDLYINYVKKGDSTKMSQYNIRTMSFITTCVIGLFVFIAAINPPALLVWVNLFAFGGLEVVFFAPIVFGLFWRKANACGALSSIAVGLVSYISITVLKVDFYSLNPIVPSLFLAIMSFFLLNPFGTKPSAETLNLFGFKPAPQNK